MRWRWLLFAVWLPFLGLPLLAAFDSDHSFATRVWGAAAVIAFAVVYMASINRRAPGRPGSRSAWWRLAGLTAIAGLSFLISGPSALGLAPFLVSFAMFELPLRQAVAVSVAVLMITLVVPVIIGDLGWLTISISVLAVGVGTAAVRLVEDYAVATRNRRAVEALDAERDRVARDVHDVLGHSLTVISVKSELAQRLIADDPTRASAELADIHALAREALTEVRATVSGLRITGVADELRAAKVGLAAAGIDVEFTGDPEDCDPGARVVFGWTIREAVTNVLRHAHATRSWIEVGPNWVEISDNGRGRGPHPPGHGLAGLADRVEAESGSLTISDRDGGGTTVRVTTPPQPAATASAGTS